MNEEGRGGDGEEECSRKFVNEGEKLENLETKRTVASLFFTNWINFIRLLLSSLDEKSHD
jgi:homoserine trans-succinylase